MQPTLTAAARRSVTGAAMAAVTAASGCAGLAYEVVWTRMFAALLGTELAAVLGVVTGFFAGFALGAFLLDRVLRAGIDAVRAYVALELAIAAWALVSIALMPGAGRMLPVLLGAAPGPAALWLAGFAFPALALLPATVAMGGTIVALERAAAAIQARPRVAAGVYGANTAGAMAGALAAVLLLMPALGLSGTLAAMAAVNAACAAAMALAAASFGPTPGPCPAAAPASRPAGGLGRLGVTLFATGLLGIAFEIVVVRLAAQILQDTVLTFAMLLAAYLFGTAAGSLLWQRSGAAPGARAVGALSVAAAAACGGTAALIGWGAPMVLARGPGLDPWTEAAVAVALFLLPTAAMGALFGCLVQAVRDRLGTLGWAVGVNSLGAAAAPTLVSAVLLPASGNWPALLAVAAGYGLLGLLWAGRSLGRVAATLTVPAAAAAALLWWPAPSLVRLPDGGRLLDTREGAAATASVVEGEDGTRFLEVNGHFRMGGTRSVRSDWRQAHVPLLLHPDPRRALFLGVGTGATLAGAAALPHVAAAGVELTPEIVALLQWFAERGAPRPPVVTADARRFVLAPGGRWDVIVGDLFHPALDGTGSLYTTEHFAAVRDRLADGGVFCQWLPLYQLDLQSLRAVVRAFLAAFPQGSAWLGNFSLQTPMLALCGGEAPLRPRPDVLAARLGDPAARAAFARAGLERPMDLLGLFLGDAVALAQFAGPGPRNTDDTPVVALNARRSLLALTAPPSALLLTLLDGIHPDPAALTGFAADGDRLAAYWRARRRFVAAGAALPHGLDGRGLIDAAAPGLLESLQLSAEFEPAYQPLMAMAQSLLGADRPAGRRLLQQIDAAAPDRGAARSLLARLPPS